MQMYRAVDFVFPQFSADDQELGKDWRPNFIDYLFLAFTTNTAFSPTDTMVLSRRAKLLMMVQSTIALVVFVAGAGGGDGVTSEPPPRPADSFRPPPGGRGVGTFLDCSSVGGHGPGAASSGQVGSSLEGGGRG
jgi:hypothetical protein